MLAVGDFLCLLWGQLCGVSQVLPNEKDKNLKEVSNYCKATVQGYEYLRRRDFSHDFFFDMHTTLMSGNVRKPKLIGKYRTEQNFIGRNDPSHSITFIPPKPEMVSDLMKNLIEYINNPTDKFRPLVRTATSMLNLKLYIRLWMVMVE